MCFNFVFADVVGNLEDQSTIDVSSSKSGTDCKLIDHREDCAFDLLIVLLQMHRRQFWIN